MKEREREREREREGEYTLYYVYYKCFFIVYMYAGIWISDMNYWELNKSLVSTIIYMTTLYLRYF